MPYHGGNVAGQRQPATPGLLARVLDHDWLSVIAGAHSVTLTRDEEAQGREFAYNMLEREARHAAMALVGCWISVLDERRTVLVKPARPTHDAAGHLLIHVEDRLSFAREQRAEVDVRARDLAPARTEAGWASSRWAPMAG